MKVGFTGTRHGLTMAQFYRLLAILQKLNCEWLKHGDCVGADAACHYIALNLGICVQVHPPKERVFRAWCVGEVLRDEEEYLMRDKIIVLESDLILACPKSMNNWTGGTWWTIRYAEKMGKKVYIIKPDGTIR